MVLFANPPTEGVEEAVAATTLPLPLLALALAVGVVVLLVVLVLLLLLWSNTLEIRAPVLAAVWFVPEVLDRVV